MVRARSSVAMDVVTSVVARVGTELRASLGFVLTASRVLSHSTIPVTSSTKTQG